MVAFDALEQMHPQPFELIGADTGRHRLAGLVQIGFDFAFPNGRIVILAILTSANNILPSRATANAECRSWLLPASRRNCSAAAARPAGLLKSRCPSANV